MPCSTDIGKDRRQIRSKRHRVAIANASFVRREIASRSA